MERKVNTAKCGVSIKLNNENETYTLHFNYISCFHTNILHIKFSWIHVMKHGDKKYDT